VLPCLCSEDEVFLSEASEVEEDAGTEGVRLHAGPLLLPHSFSAKPHLNLGLHGVLQDYEFRGDDSDDGDVFENAVDQGEGLYLSGRGDLPGRGTALDPALDLAAAVHGACSCKGGLPV
jgi:hypothetical protein